MTLPLAAILTPSSTSPNTRVDGTVRVNLNQRNVAAAGLGQFGIPLPQAIQLAARAPFTSFADLLPQPGHRPRGDDQPCPQPVAVEVARIEAREVLLERNLGAGHFVLFTSSLDNSASDLPVKPVFVSFMAELAQYLSNEKLLVKEQTADGYLQLTQSGGGSGQVEDPNGKKLLSLQGTTQAQEVLLNLTGYYRVFTTAGDVLVAVNPDRRESDLGPMQTSSSAKRTWRALRSVSE